MKNNKFKIYIILVLVLLLSGILLIFNGSTYARYISKTILNYNLKSKGFYFSSDFLDTTETQNVNSLWDGSSIHFNLKNSLNSTSGTLITDYNIDYTMNCTIEGAAATYAECRLMGTGNTTFNGTLESVQVCKNTTEDGILADAYTKEECKAGGYTWADILVNNDLFFDVVLTKSGYTLNDIIVNLSINSTAPYTKTLLGKFILHKINESNEVSMEFNNYLNYNELIVTNSNNTNKCVKISWDSTKLLLDNNIQYSSSFKDVNNYINGIKFNIEAKKNLNFKFYNNNLTETYNVNEFTIEDATGC